MAVNDTQPLISHLIELRKRLMYSLCQFWWFFFMLVYFSNDIYQLVSAPLSKISCQRSNMSATDVASTF